MKNSLHTTGFRALQATQFLEAFNDNAFKFIVMFVAIDYFSKYSGGTFYVALAGAVFILPFLLFSTYAGYFADKFSKRKIFIAAKIAEILFMIAGLFSLLHVSIWGMIAILFLMGLHSAFFSPAKYAILPEILHEDDLSEGNGQMQMFTYGAIILGQASSGYLLHVFHAQMYKISFVFIAIAILGLFTSLFITKVPPSGSTRKIELNFVKEIIVNTRYVWMMRSICLSMMGLAYFAFLGGLFQPNILLYARNLMEVNHLSASLLLVSISLGIAVGGLMAGKFSDQKVELGLVPLGALGISIFAMQLGFNYHSYFNVLLTLFLLGISCGFYIVPLHTVIQLESPKDQRGRIMATNNFYSFSAMLIASLAIYLFGDVLKINPAQTFFFMGLGTIIGAVYVCRLLPYSLLRLIVWILTHTFYKIKTIDKHNVPDKGGALMASNHISYVDALMLVVTISRPIRFIISREIYNSSMLKPLFKIGRAIPIDKKDNPKEIIRTFNIARDALKNGEIVCIFPEGQLTRTGNLLKFNAGIEHILKGVDCPVIPVNIDRIWGSIFSHEGGKYLRKWPKIIPYPVTVSFGKAMSARATTFEIRSAIMELGADSFSHRLENKVTLPEAFWREARKHPLKFCMGDSSGKKLNYGLSLISAVAMSRKINAKLFQEKTIGVLLPPSVAGALVNIAIAILNKVPVNINYTASKEALASTIKQCAMQYVITSKTFLEKTGIVLNCEALFIEDIIMSLTKKDQIKAMLMSFALPYSLSHRFIFGPKDCRGHEKLATIMFTSGSTGEPKGVMLTNANITSNLEGLYQVFHVKDNDVMLGILPFFHSFGFTGTLWFPLISGIGAVYHFNPLDAKVVGKLVKEHQASMLMATPTFLNSYIRRCEPEQFKSLRMVTVGAEKLKESLAKEFKDKFGVIPMEGYGCTELSPVVSVNLPDFDKVGELQKAHEQGTIGLPLPGIAVKVVDQNTGETLGANQDGVLWIRGPNVMKGYLNQPEKTNDVIKDGWYISGDIARIAEDGFITITDRLNRFSKIAGEMVPHIKIEDAIQTFLNSTESVCVVTAIPDDKRGEKIIVLHVVDIDATVLLDGLKQSGLPNLWIPDADAFCKIETIPILGTGKLDLGAVKRLAIQIYAK